MSLKLIALVLAAGLLAAPAADALEPAKLPRIGILSPTAPPPPASPQVECLLQGLRELGWEDGKTAKALGLALPRPLVQRADQVIQ